MNSPEPEPPDFAHLRALEEITETLTCLEWFLASMADPFHWSDTAGHFEYAARWHALMVA